MIPLNFTFLHRWGDVQIRSLFKILSGQAGVVCIYIPFWECLGVNRTP